MANDSGLLRWMFCILREIDSGVDSGVNKTRNYNCCFMDNSEFNRTMI